MRQDVTMRRVVSAELVINVTSMSDLAIAVAPTRVVGLQVDEAVLATTDGKPIAPTELSDSHGTRLHRVKADEGELVLTYNATVTGQGALVGSEDSELIRYLRPSRYCESDMLAATAGAEFSGLEGKPLLDAVSSWVGTKLEYVSRSSLPTDGAVRTLLARKGVCRDYAHLCIALLRARGVPARLVSVYAPGLDPMDFHAVCEAYVEDRWVVVDATTLAPRQSMLRIATGRDAADTAFMSIISGLANLVNVEVTATVDVLPPEDVTAIVELS
jgi:transglutaminase-like putative cysteine protease